MLAGRLIPEWPDVAEVEHDLLGRPRCPSGCEDWMLSFSRLPDFGCGAMTYGAFCRAEGVCGLGLDAAHAREFHPGYPVERVFHVRELALLDGLLCRAERMALAWSAKEATVKALGVGFNLLEPADVEVVAVQSDPTGWRLHMRAFCRGRVSDLEAFSLSVNECRLTVAVRSASNVSQLNLL